MAAPVYESVAANTVAVGVSSNAVSKPSGTTSGDLLVAFCSDGASASNGFTAPAGWTAGAVTGASGNAAIFYKIAGGSEPTSYTFTRPASTGVFVVSMVRVSGVDQTTPVADTSALGTGGGGSSSAALTGVTATAANTLLLQMLNISTTGATVTAPGGTTKVYDTNTAGTLRQVAGGSETVSAGATSTRTWTISGAPQWRGAMVAVNPAAQSVALGKVTRTTTVRALTKSVGAVKSLGKVTRASTVYPVDVISGQAVALGKVARLSTLRPLAASVDSIVALGKIVRGTTLYPVSDAATSTVALGKITRESNVYPLFPEFSYATARKVRAGGRRRTGLGQGFWEPAVATAPATVTYGDERVIAHAFTVPTMDGMQPRFDVTSADEPQHRDRILVGGVDVTYFRDALTPTPTYQLVEPLLYGPATLSLPQVAACFETPGVGALSWLHPGKTVKVQRVDRDTNAVVATDYVGVVIAFDTNGNELTVQIGGEASGRAALRYWPVPIFRSVHDIGRWVFHAVHSLGVRFKPYLGPDTGIELARFGGTGHLDYITQLCARAQNRDGAQWTVTKNGDHYEMVQKDRTTVHGTVYLDDARAVGSLRRDLAEEPNRIYGTGVTPEGQRILGGIYPGVQKTDPAPYPYHDGRTFGLGTQDADTDTGDGITVMVSRLRICRYMGAADAPGGFDKDVVRAVKALQDDAGLPETGVMNQATWNALYDLGATGMSLRWSKIMPMAQKPYTREWRRSGSGALMSRNPNYDPSRLVVDRDVDFGSGYTHKQMREWSRDEIDQSEDNWVGDIQLYSGAVVAGDHTPGDPITSILRARDIKPGMNLRLPLFAGGILVHVSAVSVDSEGLVTCSVDTRARDSLEVWEIIARNRETRRSPARAWEHQYRASGMVHDAVDGWSEVGGELGARTPLHGGEWNIVEVVAGQTGTIQKLLLETNPNAEFAVAVFGAKISAATLNHRVGNPLTATGKDKWSDETVNAILKRDHLLLFAAGDDGSPCGYSPKSKGGSNPLTGKYEDAAGFSYATQHYPVLYVAIYPDRNTSIPAGRVMWPQLEAGA